jgi:hypothetical protein
MVGRTRLPDDSGRGRLNDLGRLAAGGDVGLHPATAKLPLGPSVGVAAKTTDANHTHCAALIKSVGVH